MKRIIFFGFLSLFFILCINLKIKSSEKCIYAGAIEANEFCKSHPNETCSFGSGGRGWNNYGRCENWGGNWVCANNQRIPCY